VLREKQLCWGGEEAARCAGSWEPKEHLERWKPQRFLLLGLVGAEGSPALPLSLLRKLRQSVGVLSHRAVWLLVCL